GAHPAQLCCQVTDLLRYGPGRPGHGLGGDHRMHRRGVRTRQFGGPPAQLVGAADEVIGIAEPIPGPARHLPGKRRRPPPRAGGRRPAPGSGPAGGHLLQQARHRPGPHLLEVRRFEPRRCRSRPTGARPVRPGPIRPRPTKIPGRALLARGTFRRHAFTRIISGSNGALRPVASTETGNLEPRYSTCNRWPCTANSGGRYANSKYRPKEGAGPAEVTYERRPRESTIGSPAVVRTGS